MHPLVCGRENSSSRSWSERQVQLMMFAIHRQHRRRRSEARELFAASLFSCTLTRLLRSCISLLSGSGSRFRDPLSLSGPGKHDCSLSLASVVDVAHPTHFCLRVCVCMPVPSRFRVVHLARLPTLYFALRRPSLRLLSAVIPALSLIPALLLPARLSGDPRLPSLSY